MASTVDRNEHARGEKQETYTVRMSFWSMHCKGFLLKGTLTAWSHLHIIAAFLSVQIGAKSRKQISGPHIPAELAPSSFQLLSAVG